MRTARSLTVSRSHSICPAGCGGVHVTHAPHACPHTHTPAATHTSPAIHAPLPCTPPPWMPPTMHVPHHAHPPAMHTPQPCMPPPSHAHAPTHAPPCGQNHRRLWQYNLAPTSLWAVKINYVWLIYIAADRLGYSRLLHCAMQNISHWIDSDSDLYSLFLNRIGIQIWIGTRVHLRQCKWAIR